MSMYVLYVMYVCMYVCLCVCVVFSLSPLRYDLMPQKQLIGQNEILLLIIMPETVQAIMC